ncbi:50S ribosomal protein L3 [candidate division KSB1 bacterium]|nr:50S ribosomal protein L3 [candidate division KSB1 bacterium]NIR70243.1 50S ribosomal protein L3 [candidate division KSB1 bacterium]NIS26514.1 50S ribosomal protein L3 [candidate division KSB1 bacterium]NIT73276.1 50S ribosomal protein L3 [candidate division KSB1 bacterium]NIU23900.1 50S ribosomal protein L3 [candidate division KSB1 bacterium]
MSGLIGRKLGMSRVFDDNGRNVAVTMIQAGPCSVTQVKTEETDGYSAVQLGFEEKRKKNLTKPQLGHFAKANSKPKGVVKEFRISEADSLKLGDELTVGIFEVGDSVDVVGWSKGKGFQGVVKRHGFGGGPKTHGQSDRLRAPGSIGQSSSPSRVFKGVRMPGRMGNERITLKNKRVVKVFSEKNIIMIEGPVPGPNNGLLLIRKA